MKQSLRPRRIVQRTCFSCREVRPKGELVRLVRTPQGRVELDQTGKKSGRGAYVCLKQTCWESGLDKERLARALKVQATLQDINRLWERAESLGLEPKIVSA